jgi:complex iron-sulfur molybdoenzyme family reductase subunit gamma
MNRVRSHQRSSKLGAFALMVLAAVALRMADANPARSQATTLRAWRVDGANSLNPVADVWSDIPPIAVPLTAQQGVYPTGGGSVPALQAKAIHIGDRLFVRLEWVDDSQDITTNHIVDFSDAVAVEFPSKAASTVPAVCMGQADAGVNIWQWRADRQPDLSGSGPGDQPVVDYYPSEGDLWFPAKQAGNPYAANAGNPVQNLVARSFGTIGPADTQPVTGHAIYEDGSWSVVFSRSFVSPGADQPAFAADQRTDVAFAVWNGRNSDRNGQKQVSQFVRMVFARTGPPSQDFAWLPTALAFVLVIWILALLVRGAGR